MMTRSLPRFLQVSVLLLTSVLMLVAMPATVKAQEHSVPAVAAKSVEAAAHSHDDGSHTGEVLSPINKGLVTAITTLIVFLILLAILSKVAFGPIAAGLKAREDKIRSDIDNAEKAHASAAKKLKEYEDRLAKADSDAREILTKATSDAQKTTAALTAQAQKDIEELRAKSLRDIENDKKAAIAEIHEVTVTLSTSIAEKILKRSLNADDQRDLVRSSLEQLGNVGRN